MNKKLIYSLLSTILVLFTLQQVKNFNNKQKIERERKAKEFVNSLQIEEYILPKNSYGQVKIDLLTLNPSNLDKRYRNNKIIAQVFDIGSDSSTTTIALRVDSVFGLLKSNQLNYLYKIDDKDMIEVHNYFFHYANELIKNMNINNTCYTKPMKGELIYYVRTNNGNTYEKRLYLYNKNVNIGWESFYSDVVHLFRTIDEFEKLGTLPKSVYSQ